jgi:hypothetical protein
VSIDREQRTYELFGGALGLIGVLLIGIGTDWNWLALIGVLLLLWGNNLQKLGRKS